MTVFGKSTGQRLEVIAADFLPAGQQLYIVVADADANLHVLAYDPERESSLITPCICIVLYVSPAAEEREQQHCVFAPFCRALPGRRQPANHCHHCCRQIQNLSLGCISCIYAVST